MKETNDETKDVEVKTGHTKDNSQIEKSQKSNNYLYYKLLELVNKESDKQLGKLKNDLDKLIHNSKQDWDNLVKWSQESADDVKDDGKNNARQDCVPNGLVSDYTNDDLIAYASSSFSSRKFYDLNVYLPKLLLLSHIVDDKFQQSVQKIFNINKTTGNGILNKGTIKYKRGPVKKFGRAKSKVENDYTMNYFLKVLVY